MRWHQNRYSVKNSSPILLPCSESEEIIIVSIEKRRSEIVETALDELVKQGITAFRPGDVADYLRQKNDPISVWQLRAEFTLLQENGGISFDADRAVWTRNQRSNMNSAI